MNRSRSSLLQSWRIVLSLVRRDYAVQYAGTLLGVLWVLVQYLFQIALFWLIFGYLFAAALPTRGARLMASGDYLVFLLSGMGLWLPLSEMLLRSCGILVDNRSLIRRTAIGMTGFLRLPLAEAWLHYGLIMIPILGIFWLRGALVWSAFLGVAFGMLVILFFSGWAFVLARIGVILKDVTPLMRLALQLVFWGTPIIYPPPSSLDGFFRWNPLHGIIGLYRALLLGDADSIGLYLRMPGLIFFLAASLPVFFLSSRRMGRLVADHL